MPFLKIKLEPGGALIGVAIGVSGVRALALQKAKLPVPPLVERIYDGPHRSLILAF
jgi:hypothetical protein